MILFPKTLQRDDSLYTSVQGEQWASKHTGPFRSKHVDTGSPFSCIGRHFHPSQITQWCDYDTGIPLHNHNKNTDQLNQWGIFDSQEGLSQTGIFDSQAFSIFKAFPILNLAFLENFSLYKSWIPAFSTLHWLIIPTLHCKKWFAIFPSPAGMSLTKLSLGGNIPGQGEFSQWHPGWGRENR